MPSPFTFKKHGQSGIEVSEIFPFISRHVDEIAFLRSVYGRSNDHVQGTYEMQTGQINLGFPSVGSWVTYGLGSVASSLPAFVVMTDARGGPLGGPNDWSAGFMPAAYQGTLFRSTGDPIVDLKPPAGLTRRRPAHAARCAGEAERAGSCRSSPATASWRRASPPTSWPTGCRAARRAPSTSASESDATKKLYGLDDQITEPFGRQCLMARRLVERGVRFVQIFAGGVGNQNVDTWDAHGDIKSNHTQHAAETDLPDGRPAHRPEGARPARHDAGHHALRVRPHADLPARRRARSQSRARRPC